MRPFRADRPGQKTASWRSCAAARHEAMAAATPVMEAYARADRAYRRCRCRADVQGDQPDLHRGRPRGPFGRRAHGAGHRASICDKVLEAISGGAAQSWQMENRWETMVAGEFDFGFAIDWMRKDLAIALGEAKAAGISLPVTALVDQFYAQVQQQGGARQDTSALIRHLPEVVANDRSHRACRSAALLAACPGPRRYAYRQYRRRLRHARWLDRPFRRHGDRRRRPHHRTARLRRSPHREIDYRVDGRRPRRGTRLRGRAPARDAAWALGTLVLDLSATTSLDEALSRIAAYAAAYPDRPWIIGRGWNQEMWGLGRFPTAAELDAVVSDRPVWLERVDGHAGWANSLALKQAGVTANSPILPAAGSSASQVAVRPPACWWTMPCRWSTSRAAAAARRPRPGAAQCAATAAEPRRHGRGRHGHQRSKTG